MTSPQPSLYALVATAVLAAVLVAPSALADNGGLPMAEPESVGMSSERLERIGVGMRRLIDDDKIPGTVSLVARRGKVVHFETNGLRDVEAGLPMEHDTIFRLYSQSKVVTGAAVMILFEEGHFLMTDPVSKYLPEFADMRVYLGEELGEEGAEVLTEPAGPITIQQLATHTSGLTYGFIPTPVGKMYTEKGVVATGTPLPIEGEDATVPPPASLKEWSERLGTLPLVAQPGTEWHYGVGMDVLGRLVEAVSGMSFGEFLRARLFDPLEMPDTGFYVPDSKVARFAANYGPAEGGGMALIDDPETSAYRTPPALEMGGAGLVGTVGDYFKFAQMLANKGEFQGTRILGRRTVEFMTANHLSPLFPDDPMTSLRNQLGASARQWGAGFGITGSVVTNPATSGLPVSKGTFGWGGAATTGFWVDHEEEIVGIVHTQLTPSGTYPVRELMQLLTYQAIID